MQLPEIEKRLAQYSIGIAGAGGLGSNCAVSLVRSGILRLKIADFDRVEPSNLNRQYYFRDQLGQVKVEALGVNLKRINPACELSLLGERLHLENIPKFFADVDILVEAFDQADQKEMLLELALELWPTRPFIVGSGLAGYGQTNELKLIRHSNVYICGDGYSEVRPDNPPLAPRVGIVANMQANTVLDILLNSTLNKST